jgi:hypothetical protein
VNKKSENFNRSCLKLRLLWLVLHALFHHFAFRHKRSDEGKKRMEGPWEENKVVDQLWFACLAQRIPAEGNKITEKQLEFNKHNLPLL